MKSGEKDKSRKRLSLGAPLKTKNSSTKENEPPAIFMEANDDEAEKKERRKSRLFSGEDRDSSTPPKKKKTSGGSPFSESNGVSMKEVDGSSNGVFKKPNGIPMPSSSSISSSQQAKKDMTNEQLTELYSNCIKLSTENRINAKNSWDLNLIDYIDDIIETHADKDMMNFQAASCTLDASVKIYAYRVDSVHHEAYKVLGGLTSAEIRELQAAEEEKKDGTEEDPEVKAQKKAKKVAEVGGVNTLESNLENITVKKFDLAFDVDPLFMKTSASFDEGGARGLLLNQLSVYNDCELIFDSSDAVAESSDFSTDSASCTITDLQKKILHLTQDISSLQICPIFANFQWLKPDDQNDEDVNLEGNVDFEAFSDEDIPDAADFEMADGNDLVFDDPNVQEKEANLLEEIKDADEEDGEQAALPTATSDRRKSTEAPMFLTMENEFAYFDAKTLENWAGPAHWKFKNTKPSEDKDATKKKTKKKEPFFLNFNEPCDIDFEEAFAPPGRAATTLSAQILKKSLQNNNTLPPDVHYDVKMLTQLFSKPRWRVSLAKRRRMEASFGDRTEGQWYEYQVGGAANNDDPLDGLGGIDPPNNFDDDDDDDRKEFLIEAPAEPRRPEQIKINYAKSAKVVDVRALKETIWEELVEKKEEEESSEGSRGVAFTEILESIPNDVPKEALPDISVPFCFICLLHLANEKGLSIEQTKGNLTELYIKEIES